MHTRRGLDERQDEEESAAKAKLKEEKKKKKGPALLEKGEAGKEGNGGGKESSGGGASEGVGMTAHIKGARSAMASLLGSSKRSNAVAPSVPGHGSTGSPASTAPSSQSASDLDSARSALGHSPGDPPQGPEQRAEEVEVSDEEDDGMPEFPDLTNDDSEEPTKQSFGDEDKMPSESFKQVRGCRVHPCGGSQAGSCCM